MGRRFCLGPPLAPVEGCDELVVRPRPCPQAARRAGRRRACPVHVPLRAARAPGRPRPRRDRPESPRRLARLPGSRALLRRRRPLARGPPKSWRRCGRPAGPLDYRFDCCRGWVASHRRIGRTPWAAISRPSPSSRKRRGPCLGLACAYLQTGRSNESARFVDRAVKLRPDLADTHCCLAALAQAKEDWSQAHTELTKALQLQQTQPGAQPYVGLRLIRTS